jgi:HK97 family phage portal protein
MRWLSRKTAKTREEKRSLGDIPPALLSSTPNGPVTPDGALQIADAFACIRALADAAASLPLHVYRRTDGGRVRASGRTADLIGRPAPAMTTAALIGQIVAHLNLHGNAYIGKVRDGDRIAQLVALLPDRILPRIEGGEPRYELRDEKGRRSDHGVEDIVHIKALTTDGLLGLSPVRQARVALGLDRALIDHAGNWLANEGRPGGILSIASSMNPDALAQFKSMWEERRRGTAKAGGTAIVTGEATYVPVEMPHDDQQFLEQRKLSATEIARIFRIPAWVISAEDGGSMTYSNTEQQGLHFVTYSLRPWLVQIEQAISADRDLCPGTLYCEFLIDALLRADSMTRAQVYEKALNPVTGWMTRAEVRRLENLDPEPESARPPAEAVPTNGGVSVA